MCCLLAGCKQLSSPARHSLPTHACPALPAHAPAGTHPGRHPPQLVMLQRCREVGCRPQQGAVRCEAEDTGSSDAVLPLCSAWRQQPACSPFRSQCAAMKPGQAAAHTHHSPLIVSPTTNTRTADSASPSANWRCCRSKSIWEGRRRGRAGRQTNTTHTWASENGWPGRGQQVAVEDNERERAGLGHCEGWVHPAAAAAAHTHHTPVQQPSLAPAPCKPPPVTPPPAHAGSEIG